MLYREIIAVCSHIPTKHINTLYVQNYTLKISNFVVYELTTVFYRVTADRNQVKFYFLKH